MICQSTSHPEIQYTDEPTLLQALHRKFSDVQAGKASLHAQVSPAAPSSQQQHRHPPSRQAHWSSAFTPESSGSSGDWAEEEGLTPLPGEGLEMSWRAPLSHWSTLSAPGRIPTSGAAADMRAALAATQDGHSLPAAAAAATRQAAGPVSDSSSSSLTRRRTAEPSRLDAQGSTEEDAPVQSQPRRYARHLPAHLLDPDSQPNLQRTSAYAFSLDRSSVDLAAAGGQVRASRAGLSEPHAWDTVRPAAAESPASAAAPRQQPHWPQPASAPCSDEMQDAQAPVPCGTADDSTAVMPARVRSSSMN